MASGRTRSGRAAVTARAAEAAVPASAAVESAPVEAPADQPIPARPAPRAKDAPRTMKDLRLAHLARKVSRSKPPENVLREGLRLERVPDPSVLVLFGGTGDLAHRKVLPALYQLWRTNLLPHEFVLLAIGRRPYTDEAFRTELKASLDKSSSAASAVRCSRSRRTPGARSPSGSATSTSTSPTRPASTP